MEAPHQGPIYTVTPGRWSLRGATSGSCRAARNDVHIYLHITIRFLLRSPLRAEPPPRRAAGRVSARFDGEMSDRRRWRSPSARHATYFLARQSFLLRFSRSVPDSTADLTFDPVSWSSSTGRQPRSVMPQNRNNKERRYGNESRQPVYEAHIHTSAWLSLVRTFTQA